MWDSIIYIVVFLICWWALSFIIGGITSIPTHFLFGWDVFETIIPLISVMVVSFFMVYYLLIWGFDLHPPFFSSSDQSMVETVPTPTEVYSPSGEGIDSTITSPFYRESRKLFWIGIVLSIPIGVLASLFASWIYDRIKKLQT